MAGITQEDRLREEILGDAKAKAERVVARARNEASRIVAKAKADCESKHKQRMEEVAVEMDGKRRSIMMGVEAQLRRFWLTGREERLDRMMAAALEEALAAAGEERRRSFEQLAAEMLPALGAGAYLVYIQTADAALVTEEWLRGIAEAATGRGGDYSFSICAQDEAPAGIRMVSVDGRREYDNSYASRLQKMKSDLRTLIVSK